MEVDGSRIAAIRAGLLVLLGISKTDSQEDANYLVDKILNLRIFSDAEGKMNRSVQEIGGEILVVSQFTLMADCRRGRRPSFDAAADPGRAQQIYSYFIDAAKRGPVPVFSGQFQAHMMVHLVNDGPVTILIDSENRTRR